jgi:hypothetical protein
MLSSPPLFGWDFQYQLPADYLAMQETNPLQLDYDIEDPLLLTNEPNVGLVYTARITDPSRYSSMFVMALELSMAAIMALPLTGDLSKASAFTAEKATIILRAKVLDAQDQPVEKIPEEDMIVFRNRSQGGGTTSSGRTF